MKKIIFIIFILIFTIAIKGQKATYIGISAGLCNDGNKLIDPGSYLYHVRCSSSSFGFMVRQEINKHFSVEAAVFSKDYTGGFGAKLPGGGRLENNFAAVYTAQVPLRLSYKINLYKDKIFVLPTIGFAAVFNLEHGNGDSSTTYNPSLSSSIRSGTDSMFYYVSRWRSMKSITPLVQTGITVEFKIGKKILLDVYANYYSCFSHIEEGVVVYKINNSGTLKNKQYVNGSYSNFGLSLLYRLNTFNSLR